MDALLGDMIVRLTAAFSGPSTDEFVRQALTDNANSNVSACCAPNLQFIIPAQLRVGRQIRAWSAITVARDGAVTGNQRKVTKNAVSRRKNKGLETVL